MINTVQTNANVNTVLRHSSEPRICVKEVDGL